MIARKIAERLKVRSTWLWISVFGILISTLLALFLRGGFFHFILVIGSGFYLGLPAALAGAGLFIYGRSKQSLIAHLSGMLLLVFVLLIIILVPGYFLGEWLTRRDASEARAFCEALTPNLERWKQAHGYYPEDVAKTLPPECKLPSALRNENFYQSDGTNFTFTFADRTSLFSHWIYYDKLKRWICD